MMLYKVLDYELLQKIKASGGYCLCGIDVRCICDEFRNGSDSVCGCGVYRKIGDGGAE